jgi:hypothetical protein
MIKFFRHIRRRLLSENKISRYLIYAIGEILLVVIGILIALQINNWNENLKKEKLELSVLKELKSNLLADLKDFQSDMKVYEAATKSSDVIIDFIDGEIDYHDSLNILFGKIPVQGVFTPNKAAYDNLKVSGLRLISNDSLRAAISNLYEGTYHYAENYMNTEYIFDHGKFNDFYLKEMEEYSFYHYAKPIDWRRLVGNQEFRNLIMHRKLKFQGWHKMQYEGYIRKANAVIQMINLELEN